MSHHIGTANGGFGSKADARLTAARMVENSPAVWVTGDIVASGLRSLRGEPRGRNFDRGCGGPGVGVGGGGGMLATPPPPPPQADTARHNGNSPALVRWLRRTRA